jgi:hypothetical protein
MNSGEASRWSSTRGCAAAATLNTNDVVARSPFAYRAGSRDSSL